MSNQIHSTAIVEEGVDIGSGNVVGPYVVMERGARIGNGNTFEPGVYVKGSVTIGDGNMFRHGASVGGGPQDIKFSATDTILTIGNDNHVGEHSTLHRGSTSGKTTIGNGNYLMGNVHVGHDCILGNKIIMANDAKLGGFVSVQDRVILSAAAGVHQHVRIGEMSIVGAILRVTQDVLPYAMVGSSDGLNGLNRVGLKRSGCPAESVERLKEAYRKFCKGREPLSEFQAWLAQAALETGDAYLARWSEFIAPKSGRGYLRHGAD